MLRYWRTSSKAKTSTCGSFPRRSGTNWMADGIEVPRGVSEYDWVGGLQGSPVPVIIGEYTGLPIPATAEIVVECEAIAGEDMDEGPFGEWTGYYASSMRPEPTMKVKRLY